MESTPGLKPDLEEFIFWISLTHSQLPITNYPLPITNYQLPITHYQK
ncbi:hypothetical protein BGP_5298 [Beggiatoa sp. PS]|nr:hypothetical protein BGP_5298 [Beggiatoa sp. PS]